MKPSEDTIKSIEIGYQTAVQLWIYEGNLIWKTIDEYSKLALILIAGSIFPSFLQTNSDRVVSIVGLVLSVIGLVTTLLWWSMASRCIAYHKYWILSARELEKKLPASVRTLERGEKMSNGDSVDVGKEKISFLNISRFRMTQGISLFYIIFLLIFVILVIVNIIRLVNVF